MTPIIKDEKKVDKELISLAPTYENEDIKKIYGKYIDEALLEKEYKKSKKYKNKNIAISGGYGAGKSSVLNTYFRTAKFNNESLREKVLFVSLGSYIESNDKVLDNNEKKAIEVSILQQIIYSVPPEEIPFSRISRKDHDYRETISWSALVAFLITPILSYMLGFFSEAESFNKLATSIVGILLFFSIWWGLYYIINKFNINVIHFGANHVKAEGNKEELSLLNIYIDELVYFFKNTNKEIIVFEDIDRLEECQKVFSKLKEINSIINIAIKNKTIRFIYCIGEDVFEDAELKTKFFDAIVPIIPYLGTSTAREVLAQEINDKQNEEIPNVHFIIIGRFISNPRIAYEIINEYKIFKNNINPKEKSIKIQLLYLISYKVLYPRNFELLYKNKGILSYYLSPDFKSDYANYLHEKNIEKYKKEIAKYESKNGALITPYVISLIDRIDNQYNIEEPIKALICDEKDKYIITLQELATNPLDILKVNNKKIVLKANSNTYPQEEFFPKDYEEGIFKNSEVINNLEKITELKEKINNEYNDYINPDNNLYRKDDYIAKYIMSENHPFYPTGFTKKEENLKLNRFEQILVEKGFINENIKKLIVRKNNRIISENDEAIITKIIDNQELSLETKVENPNRVISELGVFSFINDATAIPALYKEILLTTATNSSYIEAISNKWTEKKFNVLRYVGEMNDVDVIKYFEKYIDEIWFMLEIFDMEENSDLINYYIYQTIKCIPFSKLKKESEFYSIMETKDGIIEYLEKKYNEIHLQINSLNIVFRENVNMTSKCENMIKIIYQKRMFSKCLNHIEAISKVMNINFDSKRIIESITSNKEEKIINSLLIEDISHTIRWIKMLNIVQEDSEKSLITFANENEISEEQFEELIVNEKQSFNDISKLNPRYYSVLKEKEKLNITIPNLITLFKSDGNEIKEELAQFIIKNIEKVIKLDFTEDMSKEFRIAFKKSNIFEKDIFANLCKSITKGRVYDNIENVPITNLKVFIEQGKIQMKSQESFEKILNCEELTLEEKAKVLTDSISKLKEVNIANIDKKIISILLTSNVVAQYKVDFMIKNPEYIEGDNKGKLFDVILTDKVNIEPISILNILESDKTANEKIKMYLSYEEELINEFDIETILKRMGKIFVRIINRENNIYLDNNKDNDRFIEKLIDKHHLLKRTIKSKNKIRIVFGKINNMSTNK